MKKPCLSMRSVFFVCICVAAVGFLSGPPDALADFVLSGTSPSTSFVDLGAQGFGNAPRLLTLQAQGNPNNPTDEGGQVVLSTAGVASTASYAGMDDAVNPGIGDKNSAPTLGSLGWTSGAKVEIGFNLSEVANNNITLEKMVLTLYDENNLPFSTTFSLQSPVDFSSGDIALQRGNGNAIFDFVLTPAEQLIFDGLLATDSNFSTDFHVALAAEISHVTDGPESFLAGFGQGVPTPSVPEPGTLLLLGSGLLGALPLVRRRFKK